MKTGLVLSGGGSKGAFQVGVLQYLLKNLNIKFDYISGVSTGSLQGAMVAQNKFDLLKSIWNNIRYDKDIYSRNWINIAWGGFPYKFTGIKNLLQKYISITDYQIPFEVGTVALENGEYISWTYPDWEEILASCSIPVLFPLIKKGSLNLVDGGVRNVTPLKSAIDFGCEKIYVIQCFNSLDQSAIYPSKWKFFNTLTRTIDIMSSEIKQNDILQADISNAYNINHNVESGTDTEHRILSLVIIDPEQNFMNDIDSLHFDTKQSELFFNHGYKRAEFLTEPF